MSSLWNLILGGVLLWYVGENVIESGGIWSVLGGVLQVAGGLLVIYGGWVLFRDRGIHLGRRYSEQAFRERMRARAIRRFKDSSVFRRGKHVFDKETLRADDRGVVSIGFKPPRKRCRK